MKAEIIFSSMYDDVITLHVSKEAYTKLMKRKINHIWVSRNTLPTDDGFVGEFRIK